MGVISNRWMGRMLLSLLAAMLIIGLAAPAFSVDATLVRHDYVYVGNENDDSISVIDTYNDTVIKTIDVGSKINDIEADTTGNYVYVACASGVKLIDTSTGEVKSLNMGPNPSDIVASPDGSAYYVLYGREIEVARLGTGDVIDTLPVGSNKDLMAISPDGNKLALASKVYVLVTIYDIGARGALLPETNFGNCNDVTFSPDGSLVYLSFQKNSFMALRTKDAFIGYKIPTDNSPAGIAVSQNGRIIYVAIPDGNEVMAISSSTGSAAGSIAVGNHPQEVVFRTDGNRSYVSNEGSNSVSVIDTSNLTSGIGTAIGTIPVGSHPIHMALSSRQQIVIATPTPVPARAPPSPTPGIATLTPTPTATAVPTTDTPFPSPSATAVGGPCPISLALGSIAALCAIVRTKSKR